MDSTESLAESFLRSLGVATVIYEPDGNIPPDFFVGDDTAVEVRRLNQLHVDPAGQIVGLEQADVPLWRNIAKLVSSLDFPTRSQNTYGVFYNFGRPIPSWKTLREELRRELTKFIDGSRLTPHKVVLPCGVRLHIFDWKLDKGSAFKVAGCSDRQSGGFIVGNLQFSLQYSIMEKQAKVAPYRSRYNKWWLVLIDFVSWGTDENDRRQLFDGWGIQHDFDKVYVVNPQNLSDFFEV